MQHKLMTMMIVGDRRRRSLCLFLIWVACSTEDDDVSQSTQSIVIVIIDIWRIRSGLPVMTSERLLQTSGLAYVSSIASHDRRPAAIVSMRYTAYTYKCVCVCVHLFLAAAVWLIESNARAPHRMWVRHEFAFAFVSFAMHVSVSINVSVSIAVAICICLATTTASILGICRLQINHFVGHKNRRQHCELIIETSRETRTCLLQRRLECASCQVENQLTWFLGQPLPPAWDSGIMWGVVRMLATQICKTIASIKRGYPGQRCH